jgi:hypothetical protein
MALQIDILALMDMGRLLPLVTLILPTSIFCGNQLTILTQTNQSGEAKVVKRILLLFEIFWGTLLCCGNRKHLRCVQVFSTSFWNDL